jgi:hypothetical protein
LAEGADADEQQRQALRVVHRDAAWRDVHELARMGTTAKERTLLAVLSVLGARGERHSAPAFAAEAFAKVCGCFVEADETVLYRLWKVLDGPPR